MSISTDNTKIDVANLSQAKLKEDEINSAKIDPKTTTPHDDDDTGYVEITTGFPDVEKLSKKPRPRKYGWGWLLLLCILPYTFGLRSKIFSDPTFFGVGLLMMFVVLIPYFPLRRRFINRWDCSESKRFLPALAAGFCIYLMAGIISGFMVFLDTRSMNTQLAALDGKYKDRLALISQEEDKYHARYANLIRSTSDSKQEIIAIDEMLVVLKEKQSFYREMFNDYKQTLKGKRNLKTKESWEDSIDHISTTFDKYNASSIRGLTLLRKYSETGEEKYHQEATTVGKNEELLANEYQKLLKETF